MRCTIYDGVFVLLGHHRHTDNAIVVTWLRRARSETVPEPSACSKCTYLDENGSGGLLRRPRPFQSSGPACTLAHTHGTGLSAFGLSSRSTGPRTAGPGTEEHERLRQEHPGGSRLVPAVLDEQLRPVRPSAQVGRLAIQGPPGELVDGQRLRTVIVPQQTTHAAGRASYNRLK